MSSRFQFKQLSVYVSELSADSFPRGNLMFLKQIFKNIKFPRGNYQTDSSQT